MHKINGIIGLFFHTRTGGEAVWQGRIVKQLEDGYYLVELFDWIKGESLAFRVIKIEQMASWLFYMTQKEMVAGFDKAAPPA